MFIEQDIGGEEAKQMHPGKIDSELNTGCGEQEEGR